VQLVNFVQRNSAGCCYIHTTHIDTLGGQDAEILL